LNLLDRQQQCGAQYCTRRRVVVGNVCCQAVAPFLDVFITRREAQGTGEKLHTARLFRYTALAARHGGCIATAFMSDPEQTDEARQSTILTAPLNRYHGTGKPCSKTRSKYIAISYHSAGRQGCVVRLARLLSPV
jgi:hypothetical protein